MTIAILTRRWGSSAGGRDGMSIAISYFAQQLAELGHEVVCYLGLDERPPWSHPLVEWRQRQLLVAPDEWPELTITCSAPSWRRAVLAAQAAGAVGRLVYWHHYGPLPPGYGAILARVAPSAERARGWSREIVLPPASWALYAGGERTGAEIVVPGGTRQKGGPLALQVARLLPELRWTVLSGRASEAELRPWREIGATVLPTCAAPDAWLSRARLVLSPTRAETYGLAMAEAAARGIPVVTSDLPGPRFALGDAATYLPTDAPAQAWADAVQAALDTDPVRLQPQAYGEIVRRALALGAPRRSAPRPPQPTTQTVQRRPRPNLPRAGQRRLVSLLMAVGPVSRWLAEAVRSVLEQELPDGWRLELLIGVDGVPESLEAARSLPHDPRVGVASLAEPVGTYVVANTLLQHARGELVGRVDADDVMLPGRLAALIEALADPACGLANTHYAETDEELRVLRHLPGRADGVWLYRRSVLDALGGWRPWPCAADTDLYERARALGMRACVVPRELYLARQHGQQLTSADETGRHSKVRTELREAIRQDCLRYRAGAPPDRVEPVTAQAALSGPLFETSPVIVSGERPPVWVGLASIPGRRESLAQVVTSLLPQVDRLGVFLNGYDDVPACLDDPRIEVVRSQDEGDRGDAGKMWWSERAPGYYLTCDDDLAYPPDYVTRTIEGIERYRRRAVVGWHGGIYTTPFVDHLRSRRLFQYLKAVSRDTAVHYTGTGVTGWHVSTLRPTMGDFPVGNMGDTWLGELCRRLGVPRVVLAHRADWLAPLPEAFGDSIFEAVRDNRPGPKNTLALRSWVIRQHMPWPLPSIEEVGGWTAPTTSEPGGTPATPEAAPAAPAAPAPKPRGRSSRSCGPALVARSGRSSTSAAETGRSAGR